MAQTEKKKRNRLPYMILSLIMAVIIWALVAYATDIDINKTVHNVDITFSGEDEIKENGYIVSGVNPDMDFWVKVSGKRRDIIDAIDRSGYERETCSAVQHSFAKNPF